MNPMHTSYHQIIDANINRVSEGLRVIEDYTRFISRQKELTDQLAHIRKKINQSETNHLQNLLIRDTTKDMRAAEIPATRKNTFDLLKANFKRVEEGLRVLEEYTGKSFYNQMRYLVYHLEKEILLNTFKKQLKPGVYLISHDPKILEQGLAWNVSCIQLRDKTGDKQKILKKAITLQKKAKQANIPFIVNDYIDIAIVSDADGFHSGQDDLSISEIRKLLGPHKLIGRSTKNLKEGFTAQTEGVDYVGIGPIWATPTKSDRTAIGFDYLKQAKKELVIPYVAIGGVSLEKMTELDKLKPPLVAVVRAYQDIPKIMKQYKKLFEN